MIRSACITDTCIDFSHFPDRFFCRSSFFGIWFFFRGDMLNQNVSASMNIFTKLKWNSENVLFIHHFKVRHLSRKLKRQDHHRSGLDSLQNYVICVTSDSSSASKPLCPDRKERKNERLSDQFWRNTNLNFNLLGYQFGSTRWMSYVSQMSNRARFVN